MQRSAHSNKCTQFHACRALSLAPFIARMKLTSRTRIQGCFKLHHLPGNSGWLSCTTPISEAAFTTYDYHRTGELPLTAESRM